MPIKRKVQVTALEIDETENKGSSRTTLGLVDSLEEYHGVSACSYTLISAGANAPIQQSSTAKKKAIQGKGKATIGKTPLATLKKVPVHASKEGKALENDLLVMKKTPLKQAPANPSIRKSSRKCFLSIIAKQAAQMLSHQICKRGREKQKWLLARGSVVYQSLLTNRKEADGPPIIIGAIAMVTPFVLQHIS